MVADKTDENGRQIRGARLALYRADENGGFSAEEELLEDTWTSGGEGTYTADDLAEGRIPEGYGPGDLRLHRLPPVREGTIIWQSLGRRIIFQPWSRRRSRSERIPVGSSRR